MKIVNIELHFFSKSIWNISQTDAMHLMQSLFDLNLFPAQTKEKTTSGTLVDIYSFNNQKEGLSLVIGTERITITKSLNPVGEDSTPFESLEEKLEELNQWAYDVLSRLVNLKGDVIFYRLSTVAKALEIERSDALIHHISTDLLHTLPWDVSNPKEVNIRTCTEKEISESEAVNCIVAINNAVLDLNIDGALTTQPCLAFEIDVNTIPEKNKPRFDLTASMSLHQKINASVAEFKNSILRLL
ncbi:hypothetical protein AB4320_14585 [Vibrio splendidus]